MLVTVAEDAFPPAAFRRGPGRRTARWLDRPAMADRRRAVGAQAGQQVAPQGNARGWLAVDGVQEHGTRRGVFEQLPLTRSGCR